VNDKKNIPSITTLRCISALSALSDAEMKKLADVSRLRSFKAREPVVRQNDSAKSVFLLLTGYAKVVRGGKAAWQPDIVPAPDRRQRTRKELSVAVLGPGDLFGELAAFLAASRSASVVALTDVETVEIEHEAFVKTFTGNPGLALFMIRYISRRLVATDQSMEVARGDVETRIRVLIRNFRALGARPEDLLTNTEIARMVGATREMVSRIMRQSATRR